MKKHLLILSTLLFCFLPSLFFAQQVAELTVYFDSGKDSPTPEEKQKVDTMLKRITDKKLPYKILIQGHTDNNGSDPLNQRLSYNRAKNIADQVKRDLKLSKVEIAGKSYTEPASKNTTASAKALNRRVYISISVAVPQISNIGDIKLDKQEYTVDADKNDTLTYASGTKIIIRNGIFVDSGGNKISGKVTISYVEYRDPIDFILAGAHMYYSDKGENTIFNSSGMFSISGSQAGNPVFIKKGEEIKVNFMPTKAIEPGTNFYQYSTVKDQWSDLSQLQTAARNGVMPMVGHGFSDTQLDICSRDLCDGTRMVVETGCELTKNKTPVFTNIVKKYNLDVPLIRSLDNGIKKRYVQLRVVYKTLDSITKELNTKPAYTFRKTESQSSAGFAFRIDCDTSLKNNFIDLENVTWLCTGASKRTISRLIDSSVYEIKMSKMDSKGNAELKITHARLGKKRSVLNVKMELPEENTPGQRKETYKAYKERVKASRKYIRSIVQEQQAAEAQKTRLQVGLKMATDSLSRELSKVKEDSAQCFWSNNRPFMNGDEKEMIMLFWYEHFQKNMSKYEQMYTQMRASNAAADSCAAVAKRLEVAIEVAKREGRIQNAANQIMISLSVGSFGMFNCDQIRRLKSPETILAGYTDANGKSLNITSIYLIDDAINSVLIYNGYMDFSPAKFPYSPRSNNRLIAFDENGDPWLCSYENFKQGLKTGEKKIFTLKKVNAAKSKEELSAMK